MLFNKKIIGTGLAAIMVITASGSLAIARTGAADGLQAMTGPVFAAKIVNGPLIEAPEVNAPGPMVAKEGVFPQNLKAKPGILTLRVAALAVRGSEEICAPVCGRRHTLSGGTPLPEAIVTVVKEQATIVPMPLPRPKRAEVIKNLPAQIYTRNTYDVFGSTAVSVGKLRGFGEWTKVSADILGVDRDICRDSDCKTAIGRKFAGAVDAAKGLNGLEALKLINTTVNRHIVYKADKGDHWASLNETMTRGAGDCEDYALAKMALLVKSGFPREALQLVVLKDTRRQLYHAVLAANVDGHRYVLDNLSSVVAKDDVYRSYVPIASFVGEKSYIHGFKDRRAEIARIGAGPITPGAGI